MGQATRPRQTLAVAAGALVLALLVDALGLLTAARESMTDWLAPEVAVSQDFVVVGLDRDLSQADLVLPPSNRLPGVDTGDWSLRLDDGELTSVGQVVLLASLLQAGADTVVYATVPDLDDFVEFVELVGREAPLLAASGRVLTPSLISGPMTLREAGQDNELVSTNGVYLKRLVLPGGPLVHSVLATPTAGAETRFLPLRLRSRAASAPHLSAIIAAAALHDGATPEDLDQPRRRGGELLVAGLRVKDGGQGGIRISFPDELVELPQRLLGDPGARVGASGASASGPSPVYLDASVVMAAAAAGVGLDEVAASGAPGTAAIGRLDGAIVLLGDVGIDTADYVRVPGGPASGIPEIWAQAAALNTVLQDAYIVPAKRWVNVAGAALLALAGAWLLGQLPLALGAGGATLAGAGWVGLGWQRIGQGAALDLAHPLLALVAASAAAVVTRALMEARHRHRVAGLFAQYVPEEVAKQLLDDADRARDAAEGERVEVTALFADLRGFTRLAGKLDPPLVKDILNVYYRHATQLILDAGGTVMQFVGDEVFAVFGAPLAMPDHADRALKVALQLQDARDAIAADLAAMDLPPIDYGIGLQSGAGVAAHVGDQARRQYGIVGDTINVGARLCSQAGIGEVVISEDVVARLTTVPELEDLGAVYMKGVERDLAVFRVVR